MWAVSLPLLRSLAGQQGDAAACRVRGSRHGVCATWAVRGSIAWYRAGSGSAQLALAADRWDDPPGSTENATGAGRVGRGRPSPAGCLGGPPRRDLCAAARAAGPTRLRAFRALRSTPPDAVVAAIRAVLRGAQVCTHPRSARSRAVVETSERRRWPADGPAHPKLIHIVVCVTAHLARTPWHRVGAAVAIPLRKRSGPVPACAARAGSTPHGRGHTARHVPHAYTHTRIHAYMHTRIHA
jgi:hypothetical protein